MRILITAGSTREPIDAVRYIGNRSSGQMGAAIARAALSGGHAVTIVLGPATAAMPEQVQRVEVETTRQMHDAVLAEFGSHDLLIMAAAVADFRPAAVLAGKRERSEAFTLELEPTEDILLAVAPIKRPDQRVVGFSLVGADELQRSVGKLRRKGVDLLVHNPLATMNSPDIAATLLWPDGRREELPSRSKAQFADNLLQRALELFP